MYCSAWLSDNCSTDRNLTEYRYSRGIRAGATRPGSGDLRHYWNRILASNVSSSLFYKPFRFNINAVCVSVSTTVLGCLLAWILVNQTSCKKLLLAIVIPYMIPSQCNAQAWLTMFKNTRIGGQQDLQAIGIAVPDCWHMVSCR